DLQIWAKKEGGVGEEVINTAEALQRTIHGKVTNEKGEPIPGITVTVKGTNIATKTDTNGDYQINVPSANDILLFTGIGLAPQERQIEASGTVNVTLKEMLSNLEEITVVVGYGTQKKVNLTGAVSQVSGE